MTNVLKRNRMVMLCLMALLACCLVVVVCFTQRTSASVGDAVYAPVYTAPDIPSGGDGAIVFGNFSSTGAITQEVKNYASVITAVYLKDVRDGGDYEALEQSDWSITANSYVTKSVRYNGSSNISTLMYGPKLTISYRQFREELTNGAEHDYKLKVKATGYEDLDVDLRVVARAAQDMIVRVFASQADADSGTIAYQKVLTLADLQGLAQHQQFYTLYCGMTGMGADKMEGVYLTDVLDKAFTGTAYAFASGDKMKFRPTDFLRDQDNYLKQKSGYDMALGDLTALNQNAWYSQTHNYDSVFADRYYFPGMFAAYDKLLAAGTITVNPSSGSYTYSKLLTEPLCLEGAVKVEPMLALKFGERVIDRAMAGSEQFPAFGGSLAKLEAMGMNQNDRYRFCFGQMKASDADGNVTLSAETTRFMITYNIFGIDIIKGDAASGQTPPVLKANTGGDGVKVTYADGVSVNGAYSYYTNKITGVFVNGEQLNSSQYDLTVGNLIIKEGAAPLGNCTVKITANGYADDEISFNVPVKITGYEAYSDHDGEVYNQLDGNGNIVNQTDHQKFHVTVRFNGGISVTDTAALRNELVIKLNNTLTLANADNPSAGMYATPYAQVAAGADGKSLEFTLHIGFAAYSGKVDITAPNGLTTIKDLQGNSINWQDIAFLMPNGVELKTESQIAAQPEQNINASVKKKVIAPDSTTRGMVHMLLLKNGQPVGTLNSYGANLTTHYHNYLNLNAEKYAALIPSWYNSKFGTDYPLVVNGDELTITAANSAAGDVIDLRIVAYPQDRDTQADQSALNALIEKASGVNGSKYTIKTYNALQNELYIARSMAGSSYYLQSEVDAEAAALQDAIDSLRRQDGGSGSDGSSNTPIASAVDEKGSATITADSLKKASEVKVTGVVELVLDANAVKTIGVEKDLVVSAVKVDNNTLSADLQEKIGNRPVFDIDITSGGKAVTDLGQGNLQISIPYVLTAGEKAEQIIVYYIDADGKAIEMSGAHYDAAAKAVVFTTNHLSRYAIGYKEPVSFTDVPAGHWAADSINYLVEEGIINGKTATTFAPNDNITRAEFVRILAGIAGIDAAKYTTTSFSDVAADAWFAPYVAWAGQVGVAQGADGKFNPNAPITRQDMAAMIARFVKDVKAATLPTVNEAVTFADNGEIADYAADAVAMMQKAGIINGKGNNQFAPLDNATRAEAAKMLAALMQILKK